MFEIVFLSTALQANSASINIGVSNIYKTRESFQYDLEVTSIDQVFVGLITAMVVRLTTKRLASPTATFLSWFFWF